MRLFKIGDRVKISDVTGDVIEKSLLVTRVRTIKNKIVSIPNSTIMNSHTVNYTSDAPNNGLIIHTTVKIGYDLPWRDMHQSLIDAALKTGRSEDICITNQHGRLLCFVSDQCIHSGSKQASNDIFRFASKNSG
ncbi:mechanosensitive ion channel domain-containing protein [Cytophaga aurantiaca]|uniref:mechanosensitive ion channel domain-containing protein n=1 Tax=Cytophaga aurantiaca TaxID=29530 RepID=UPI0003A6E017